MLRKQFAATAILACAAGTVFGYAPGTYTASYPGQNGDVPVSVTFSKDRIESVVVGENKETIGIGQTAVKNLPGRIVAAQSLGVDMVSGGRRLREAGGRRCREADEALQGAEGREA